MRKLCTLSILIFCHHFASACKLHICASWWWKYCPYQLIICVLDCMMSDLLSWCFSAQTVVAKMQYTISLLYNIALLSSQRVRHDPYRYWPSPYMYFRQYMDSYHVMTSQHPHVLLALWHVIIRYASGRRNTCNTRDSSNPKSSRCACTRSCQAR